MSKEKTFAKPEAEIIIFLCDDIITTSAQDEWGSGNIGGIGTPTIP